MALGRHSPFPGSVHPLSVARANIGHPFQSASMDLVEAPQNNASVFGLLATPPATFIVALIRNSDHLVTSAIAEPCGACGHDLVSKIHLF